MGTGLMISLLFAGQHTSSNSSASTLLHLLRSDSTVDNTEHLQAVLDEQQAMIAEFGDELNYDVLEKMDRLHVSIKEGIRLCPPLIFVMRKVKKAFSVKGYTVPVGDLAFVSPPVSHRVESIFTN